MKHHVICWKSTDFSEEYIASILSATEQAKQESSMRQAASKANFFTVDFV
jgi:hypothetical protein